MDLKHAQKKPKWPLDGNVKLNVQGVKETQLTNQVCTYLFRLCQYPVLPVLRCQAHLVLASALGSHMGRCLYETLLCPEEATNGRLQVNHWLAALRILVWQHFLRCEAPTQAHSSPSLLPKFGWRWPSRLTSGTLSRLPRESLAQVPNRSRSVCSSLQKEMWKLEKVETKKHWLNTSVSHSTIIKGLYFTLKYM